MATGSRGVERDVDNDNVTPSQPALKNGAGHTHSNTCKSLVHLYYTRAHTHTHLDAEVEEQFSSYWVVLGYYSCQKATVLDGVILAPGPMFK